MTTQDSFHIGIDLALAKVAASSNPAAPQKSSKGGMERDEKTQAPYTNGGGRAGAQTAGEVQKHPTPWPGYLSHGDKKPGVQTGGDVENRGGAPDTGEKGSSMTTGDSQAVSKNAAFDIGVSLGLGARG